MGRFQTVKSIDESNKMWQIKGLGAENPEPKLKEKLMLFGQFIGDWDIIDAKYIQADGTWVEINGEVHFGWILGGTAIQDVWMGQIKGSKKVTLFGTTTRFFDPKIDAWRSTWLSPIKGLVQTFIGRKVNDEIVLELQTKDSSLRGGFFRKLHPLLFDGMLKKLMTTVILGR